MSAKNRTAPASSERRAFLKGGLALAGATLLPGAWTPAHAALPKGTLSALADSNFVYVSPLRSDGSESACHGEVWYAWIGGTVVLITATTTWKARALARGLDRARIWVGNHGRSRGVLGRNERFRVAPSFDARVRRDEDPALLDDLLQTFGRKYPAEIGDWEERMRQGFADGDRILLRYAP